MNFSFELKDFDAGGRIGIMKLGNKILETPNLFPVVSPFDNLISPRSLYEDFKAQALFTNAYIIYKNQEKNPQILEKGLHKHLDFPGIIATDSGGFQDYMYAGEIKISPEEIEPFQEKLGADCPVILDIPVQTTDSYEEAKKKVEITIQRAKDNIKRRTRQDTAWFGPIHGSIFPDLLKISSIEMSKLDFGIYAIGGVVKTFMDYRFDLDVSILLQVRQFITPARPLHMFGLGLPNFFALAVACGADTFDSAAYILYAKDGRYFGPTGTRHIDELTELPCNCPICSKYTANELKKAENKERIKALASHNLYCSFGELKIIRQAIREGSLWDLVEQRVHAHPKLIEALNITKNYSNYFISLINLNKTRGVKYLGDHTFYRPEIIRARKKIQEFHGISSKNLAIFIPELDLPSKNSIYVENWINKIQGHKKKSEIQIIIVSNLFGLIPIELSDLYPISQHEGSGEIYPKSKEYLELIKQTDVVINNHEKIWNRLIFLIPKEYENEFKEKRVFNKETHFISSLMEYLTNQLTNKMITTYSHFDDLINEI